MRTHMVVWTMGMGLLLVGAPAAGQVGPAPQAAVREAVAIPAPWMAQDPGDSLYTAARDALTRGDYRTAVRQFQALRDRYPRSAYVGDAHYWEAYAHSKLGSKDDLRTALKLSCASGFRASWPNSGMPHRRRRWPKRRRHQPHRRV
jgi:hypothetical protein